MSWRTYLAMMLIGAATAVVVWTGMTVGEHLWADHQDHHLVLDLLRYNIQQGRLVPLAGASSPPPPAAPPQPGPAGPAGPPAGKGK